MRLKAACLFCLLVGLSITVAGLAQEGHPLVGTWYGDWGPTPTHRNQISRRMERTSPETRFTSSPTASWITSVRTTAR